MSAIYIHIPFCRRACSYCDFYFSTVLQNQDIFTQSLLKEIEHTKNFLPKKNNEIISLNSFYFGGGTPSLLQRYNLVSIFEKINQYYQFSPTTEITLETNPEDFSEENLILWKSLGINRLSIGIQSFSDERLNQIDRSHDTNKSIRAIEKALKFGFHNISIDLIYGLPSLTLEQWEKDLDLFFSFKLPHISCYLLTVENKTKLQKQIQKNDITLPKEEMIVKQYYILLELMQKNNYLHYEISNFALPKNINQPDFNSFEDYHFSKHNYNYWQNKPYLGLGPSAHSFDGNRNRYYNIRNNKKYIEHLQKGVEIRELETLSVKEKYNEYLLTNLRTVWGCDLEVISEIYKQGKDFQKKIKKYFDNKMAIQNKMKITLTSKGKLYSDQILLDLIL